MTATEFIELFTSKEFKKASGCPMAVKQHGGATIKLPNNLTPANRLQIIPNGHDDVNLIFYRAGFQKRKHVNEIKNISPNSAAYIFCEQTGLKIG